MVHFSHVPMASFSLQNHYFTFPSKEKGKQTKLDHISCNTPYHYGLAKIHKVLQVSIGILVWLATDRASLHHIDQT